MKKSIFITELIEELEVSVAHETDNRTETNYNGFGVSTAKRRLEAVKEAEFLLETGELTLEEAEEMATEALYV